MTLDILEHSIARETNMQRLTMIVYILLSLHKIAERVAAFFLNNFIDGRIRFCTCLSIQIYSVNVSSIPTLANLSFVRNFTLVRIWWICVKISNNSYRFFFWHNRDYIEKLSTDCCATIVGAMFDKQLSVQCAYATMGQFLFRNKHISVGQHHFGKD